MHTSPVAPRDRTVVARFGARSSLLRLVLALALLALGDRTARALDYTTTRIPGFANASCVAVADFDRDGRADLAVTSYNDGGLIILMGDGLGGFTQRYAYGGLSGPWALAAGDVNGDGAPDLVVANYTGNNAALFFNAGNGSFNTRLDLSTAGTGPFAVVIEDLNGDGKVDAGVVNYLSGTWAILAGNGASLSGATSAYTTGSYPAAIACGDVNADGHADVAIANYGSLTLSLFIRDTAAPSSYLSKFDLPVTGKPLGIALADLSRDGKLDLAITSSTTNRVETYIGSGLGSFTTGPSLVTATGPRGIAVADLDRDGGNDIVVTNQMSNSATVFRSTGSLLFTTAATILTDSDPRWVAIGDFDGPTGDRDIAISTFTGSSVWVATKARRLTTLSLSVTPDITDPGDPVTLTATISPADATGSVRFLDGETEVGTAPLVGGVASLSLTTLASGTRLLSAVFPGNTLDRPCSSPAVTHEVRAATEVAVTSSRNPAPFGTEVVFTATIEPDAFPLEGTIRFAVDGADATAGLPLVDGAVSWATSTLPLGSHEIVARYTGDASHAPGAGTLAGGQAVRRIAEVALSTLPAPSSESDTVSIVVQVTPSDATGAVTIRDGDAVLGVAPLVSGVATLVRADLALGAHPLSAIYPGDSLTLRDTSAVVTHTVQRLLPTIVAVRDVPNDQGGRVTLTWRFRLDRPDLRIVTGYRIWRRVPPPTAERAAAGAFRVLRSAGAQETFWEAVADLPAAQRISYGYTAATTQDSMASGNPFTAFLVQALTADPWVFFDSAPDSGYSIDNLAPPMPAPFAVTYGVSANRLHWTSSLAPDLQAFHVHRGGNATFEATPANRIAITTDTTLTDAPGSAYYKLIAVDVHGNRSLAATASPQVPVGVLASLASLETAPDRIGILWYAPGIESGTIAVERRTPESDWRDVSSLLPDGSGYLSFVDTDVVAGGRYGYRLRLVDGGTSVTVAEVWAVADRLEFVLDAPRPNPAIDGRVTVTFALPIGAPARLELLDVAGRRVATREVGSLGAGRHTVVLGDGHRLAPGVFLVRLTQGPEIRVRRVVVIG